MHTENSQITLWPTLVKAIDRIQEKAISAETSESLVTLLLEMVELPIEKDNIAIVYQNYGAKRPEFWAISTDIRKREIHPVTHRTLSVTDEPSTDFSADHPLISRVISSGQREYLKSNIECVGEGLPEAYQSFLVVPMTIRSGRTIGAFILFSKEEEGAFTDELAEVMDILSNRFAYFIRHNIRRRRNVAFQYIQNQLYSQRYKSECALIDDFIQGLTAWFEHDKVEILIKHPLDTHSFIRACCVEERDEEGNRLEIHSVKDFRLKPAMKETEICHLLGDTRREIMHRPVVLNSEDEIKSRGITAACKSWLATPMRLKKNVIVGYLILYNEDVEYAFDSDEDTLIDSLSDAVAMMIGTLRSEHFQEAQREIRESKVPEDIDNDDKSFIDSLCQTTVEKLKKLYGVEALTILRYRHSDAGLETILNNNPEINTAFAAKANEKRGFSRLISDPSYIGKTVTGVYESVDEHWVRVYFGTLKAAMMDVMLSNHLSNSVSSRITLHIRDEESGIVYFVAPMRSGTHSMGCFAFPASHIGDFTAQAIDDLADTFGKRIAGHENRKSSKLLTKFGKKISSEGTKDKEGILTLAKEFISRAMYTKHLYIALYDPDKNEIHFALALHDNKPWDGVHDVKRKLSKGKLGKTEKIILTGEPILHYTRVESEKWYREPEHAEHAGNALASWLGVPIYSERGVVGVIATYHESLDFIFSERDKFFLQQIAGDVAGMLRSLELQELTSKIVNYEEKLQRGLNAQDVAHKIKTSLSAIVNQSKITGASIGRHMGLENEVEELNEVAVEANEILKTISEFENTEKDRINISKLLRKIISQVSKENSFNNITIKTKNDNDIYSMQHYRSVQHIIYSLLTNACEASVENSEINVFLTPNKNNFDLIIKDNGSPLQDEDRLFHLGYTTKVNGTGYATWRAKDYAKKNSGDLVFYSENSFKCFHLTLPQLENKKIVYIIDDQRIWRNIISSWLIDIEYEIRTAKNTEEAMKLLRNDEETPDLILVDIRLNTYDSENRDGRAIINYIEEQGIQEKSKIVVFSAFVESKEKWPGFLTVISKTNSDGNAIEKEEFLKEVGEA